MSKEIVDGLENLSQNVEYIIDWLEGNKNKPNDINASSIDFISNEITSFSGYLQDIDSNISNINNNLSGFLDGIQVDDALNDTPEVTQFNQTMLDVISKIDELKASLDNLNVDLNLGVNSEQLSKIQAELQDNLNLNIDTSYIEDFMENINSVLSDIENIKVDLDISDSIENIQILKDNLTSIKELDFENVNLDVFSSEKLDGIIGDLEKLNNIDITEFADNLESIKDINLEELENIDISNTLESISTISTSLSELDSFSLDLNINVNSTIEKIKQDISEISTSFENLNIEANVEIKPSVESVENLQTDLDSKDLNITPTIDITSQIEDLNNKEFDIKINPIIDLDDIKLHTNLDKLSFIKPDEKKTENKELLSFLDANNKVLQELTNAISKMNEKDEASANEEVVAEKLTSEESTSIINVEANTPAQTGNDLSEVIPLLQQMVQTNAIIMKKLTKIGFNTDLDF